MSSSNRVLTQLQFIFSRQLDNLNKLCKLIEVEKEVLQTSRAPESVEETAVEKQALVLKIEDLHIEFKARLKHIASLPTSENFKSFLVDLDESGVLPAQWEEIVLLSERCQRKNDVNGEMVRLALSHTEKSLDLLRGSKKETDTYLKSGKSKRLEQSRPISEA